MAVGFAGESITVAVQDESGQIDLNTAPAEVLTRLFESAGLDEFAAAFETDRVLDWREPGDLQRLNGAKRDA